MCLFPRFIKNPKYTKTKKNGGNVPSYTDPRVLWVPIGCGKCKECLKQKANGWRTRLFWELKKNQGQPHFMTFTFSNEALEKLCNELGVEECNAVATVAVRRFLERWRKKYKKSLRHWLVTELGHPSKVEGYKSTERIHLHGIIWTDEQQEVTEKIWGYGWIDYGKYVNKRSINYIVKYIHKIDTDHKNYVPIVLTSPGIGNNFIESQDADKMVYRGKKTTETMRLDSGQEVAAPIYYRNKIYSEEEREQLWINRLNREERYINGQRIDVKTTEGERIYYDILKVAQEENKRLGYGDASGEWSKKDYNVTINKIKKLTPIKKDVKLSKTDKNKEGKISLFEEKVLSLQRDSRKTKPRRTNKKWSTQLN